MLKLAAATVVCSVEVVGHVICFGRKFKFEPPCMECCLMHRLFSRQSHFSGLEAAGGDVCSGISREVVPPVLWWRGIDIESPPTKDSG